MVSLRGLFGKKSSPKNAQPSSESVEGESQAAPEQPKNLGEHFEHLKEEVGRRSIFSAPEVGEVAKSIVHIAEKNIGEASERGERIAVVKIHGMNVTERRREAARIVRNALYPVNEVRDLSNIWTGSNGQRIQQHVYESEIPNVYHGRIASDGHPDYRHNGEVHFIIWSSKPLAENRYFLGAPDEEGIMTATPTLIERSDDRTLQQDFSKIRQEVIIKSKSVKQTSS